jgi:hypothetical protein
MLAQPGGPLRGVMDFILAGIGGTLLADSRASHLTWWQQQLVADAACLCLFPLACSIRRLLCLHWEFWRWQRAVRRGARERNGVWS